jgi:hypothetical protein
MPMVTQHVFKIGNTQRGDLVAAAEPLFYVPAPAVRPLPCLRRRCVAPDERPEFPKQSFGPSGSFVITAWRRNER